MDNRPVLFLDSGIGGIPYCRDFIKRNPCESVLYLADRENFPYGPRSREEIAEILIELTEKLTKKADPKIAVLACNTASISALASLRRQFPRLPFVGTVPAIKPAASACKSGVIGVLGTGRTIEDIRSLNLHDGSCGIFGLAAPELVCLIEEKFYKTGKEEKAEIVNKYISKFREAGADTLVLGCTHFLYLWEEFHAAAAPDIKIFDSLEGITKRIEYLLDENDSKLRASKTTIPQTPRLILSGTQAPDTLWHNRAEEYNFNLCLLEEI